MNPISFDPIQTKAAPSHNPTVRGDSFGEWLDRSLKSVNQLQQAAGEKSIDLVSGAEKDIHGTMIAMQKADVAMSLLIEVRNKLISAYDELKRMQF